MAHLLGNLRFLERPTNKLGFEGENGYFYIKTEKVLQEFSINHGGWIDVPFVKWDPEPEEYLQMLQTLKKTINHGENFE